MIMTDDHIINGGQVFKPDARRAHPFRASPLKGAGPLAIHWVRKNVDPIHLQKEGGMIYERHSYGIGFPLSRLVAHFKTDPNDCAF